MTTAPDFMPVLAAGKHASPTEGACVMELVSYLAGEPWSDSPDCTHPVLARMAQVVNDGLPDSERHLLVPLIGRLFGTGETGTEHEQKVLSVRLAVWCGRQVLPLAAEARAVCERALAVAEAWTRGEATETECAHAAHAAAHAAHAAYAAAYAAANAAAYAAYAAAHAAAHVAAHAAHAANADLVGLLTGLLDHYDDLTGRDQHREVTETELRNLAALSRT